METGMGAREQPLSIVVSTAGDNIAGPCRADWLECQKVLQGTTTDETLFALIFTIDKDDDWTSESALRKANPNYGVSVSAEFLLAQQQDAINNPRKQGHFKTKHLNAWVQARDAFIDLLKWRACADESLSLDQYRGRRCYLGLDLASKIDLCALELLFPETDGTFTRFGKYYLPRATVDLPQNEHYREYETLGLLTVTEGNITDYSLIFEDICDLAKAFELAEIAYDPHNATMLVTALTDEGLPVVEFGPTVLNFSEPMKQIEALILNLQFHHNGDKVMEWAMSNVVAKADRKDNVYPNKETNEKKIDPFVALCMAMGRCMAGGEKPDDWSGFLAAPVIG
jgi:phage terminase large subunit-like protein